MTYHDGEPLETALDEWRTRHAKAQARYDEALLRLMSTERDARAGRDAVDALRDRGRELSEILESRPT